MSQSSRFLLAMLAIVIAWLALADASVRAPPEHPMTILRPLSSGHPELLTRSLQLRAAIAARNPSESAEEMRGRAQLLMKRDPLSSAAPLFLGAGQQVAGNASQAGLLYKLAVARQPRDPAARLLYADSLLRNGRVGPALDEMVVLAKVSPLSATQVNQAISNYARSPGAVAQLRPLFARNPTMRDTLLRSLAADPANLPLIESLARGHRPVASGEGWPQILINTLLGARKFAEARSFWSNVTGKSLPTDDLFNPTFAKLALAKPFDWELATGPYGLAEIAEGGGLNIVYHGREDGQFAKQLVTLRPGNYRLSTRVTGSGPFKGLGWRITCATGGRATSIPLVPDEGEDSTLVAEAGCPAYWVELVAAAPEVERSVETVIQSVRLERAGQ